jgi:hypothetical protein
MDDVQTVKSKGGRPKRERPVVRLRLDLAPETVEKLKDAAGPGGVSKLVESWVRKLL